MASNKRSARAKQRVEFESTLSDMSDVFAREDRRMEKSKAHKEEYRRYKACESKNRYSSHVEAASARRDCEFHGTYGLNIYRCEHCGGWHLTSKNYRS